MHKSSLHIFFVAVSVFFFLSAAPLALAFKLPMPDFKGDFNKKSLKSSSTVTLQADQVSFSTQDNKAHAKGNVVVDSSDNQHLFCDQLDLDRTIQQVVAEGNVYLDTPKEQVIAQGLTYNFNDHTGQFRNAKVYADPYQIAGQEIDKLSDNHFVMKEGYLTTSDWDQPDYRIGGHEMDIYMHDKAIIRGMKIYLGKVPVMYLPYYDQDLKNRQIITFEPGEKKNFGLFLLTTVRLKLGSHVQLTLHADVRERTGFGEGFDVKYNTPNFGSGLVSAYYADENKIATTHLWDLYRNGVKKGPTTHHELYRIIWRHRWQIDKNTNAVWQYYKVHDYDLADQYFLKNYFPRDYQQNAQDSNYDTYFLLTHNMAHGTLTFDVDTSRENRPLRGIERIPEVGYTLNNTQIGKTGFYAKSTDVYSDLSWQNYPKTFNYKTQRFDSNNDISRPFKLGFISFNPHAGGEETYYSRTLEPDQSDIIRGMFRSGVDMSTKFYRVWNYQGDFWGMKINHLRHVITPTISYLYQSNPTFPSSELTDYDSNIDNLYKINQLEFGLLNELQTKRAGEVVDLLRFLVTTNYGLKGTTLDEPEINTLGSSPSGVATSRRGFNAYDTVLDISPTKWLNFHNDNEYDFHFDHWNSENFDGEIHVGNWSFSLGSRYTRFEGDQITTEVDYTINPKWKFKIYNTYPLVDATDGNTTSARENEYVLTRDLHEWEMDMSIDQLQGQGTTFYVLFRLKAFPDMKFNALSDDFAPSRPGNQNQ